MKFCCFKYRLSQQDFLLILILLLSFIAYSWVGNCEFLLWDDDMQITKNPYVRNLTFDSLIHNITVERFTSLTLTIFSVLYKIWGNNPAPFHWLNLIMHLVNVVLVYRLCMFFFKNKYSVLLVTLLFALHPLRVESVVWISEFKGLLSSFFSLTAFLFYIKYLQNKNRWMFFVGASIASIIASFAKIHGLLVPLSLLLFDIYFRRTDYLQSVLEKIILLLLPFFILNITVTAILVSIMIVLFVFKAKIEKVKKQHFLISIILITLSGLTILSLKYGSTFIHYWRNDPENQIAFSFGERFLLAGYSLWFYLRSLFYPYPISAVHPYPTRNMEGSLPFEFYLTGVILFVVIAMAMYFIIKRKRINPLILFGFFFFVLNISLYLHIIPIEGRIAYADRYTYLPYLGLFIIMAVVCEKRLFNNNKFKIYVSVLLIALATGLPILTYSRVKYWKNTHTLFNDVVKKNPSVAFAYLNLAAAYMLDHQPDSALLCFNKSIQLDSLDVNAFYNRAFAHIEKQNYFLALKDLNSFISLAKSDKNKALAYAQMGEIYRTTGNDSTALAYFEMALRCDSTLSIAYNKRGIYYLNLKDYKNALKDFENAVKFNKFNSEAINNVGMVLLIQGNNNEAIKYFSEAISLSPDYSLAYDNRAYALVLNGNFNEAIVDYNTEIKLNPRYPEAYISRGRVYANMKNYQFAIRDFDYVLKLKPNDFIALTNRAYAYYYSGQYEKSRSDFSFVTNLYPANPAGWQNIGWLFMQLKEYDKAITAFDKSISLDDSLINSYVNLGYIYIEVKNYAKSAIYLKNALDLNPRHPEALFFTGELYRYEGKAGLSCEFYKKAAENGSKSAIDAQKLYCIN